MEKDSILLDAETYRLRKKRACPKEEVFSLCRITDKKSFVSFMITESGDTLFVDTETKNAEFKGGTEQLTKYLLKTIRYPTKAERQEIQGRVVVSFIVTETGMITDIKVVRSVHPLLDEEAMRIIRLMPDWEPGEYNGIRRKFIKTIPLKFKLAL